MSEEEMNYLTLMDKTKLHTFEEAIAALKTGKKIMRASSESQFWSHKPEGNRAPMITRLHPGLGIVDNCFSTEDIFANDWIIRERLNELKRERLNELIRINKKYIDSPNGIFCECNGGYI